VVRAYGIGADGHRAGGRDALRLAAVPRGTRLIKDEKELLAARDQAHSYALWVIPAYYVITDGKILSVWDFQGAVAPDRELLRVSQGELAGSFGGLYSRLNPQAAAAARKAKISRQEEPR
jgi:hypothetical protein